MDLGVPLPSQPFFRALVPYVVSLPALGPLGPRPWSRLLPDLLGWAWDLQLWCAPADVQRLRLAVEARGLQVEAMDIVYVPHTFAAPLQVTGATGNDKNLPPDSWEAFYSLVTQIDDLDDVIRVNHNHPETPEGVL